MSFLKENKKVVIPVGIILGILVVGTSVLGYQVSSDKIAKNVYVAGINIQNLTKSQAISKLENSKKFDNITLNHKDMKWQISPSDLDMKIDFKKTVDNAFNINRSGGFISNIFTTLKSDFGSKTNISLATTYDVAKLEKKLTSIKDELDAPVKNASLLYKDEKTSVVPDEDGREMNVAESKKKIDGEIKNDKFDISLVVKLEQAKLKADDLKGIDTLLGGFSTNYGGMPGRDFNIRKSAQDSSGIILKPNDEFSFNGLTGEKTISNGYKYAPVIESGKLTMGVGGGVCQTSSTIFNAALLSGMEITTRRNHTIPSDYVALGRDATVYDGNPGQDFKFKNPYKHNIYIKNFTANGKIYSQIFGNKEDFSNIDVTTQMLGYTGAGSKTITDPTLPAGKKVVEKYASPGYTVATYRIYKDASGKTTKTEKIGISSYPAKMGIVRVGAKPVTKPATQKPAGGASQQAGGATTGTTGANSTLSTQ